MTYLGGHNLHFFVILILNRKSYVNLSKFIYYNYLFRRAYVDLMIASYAIAIVGCLTSIISGLIKNKILRFIATFLIFVAAVLNLAALICYTVKLD
jgi:ABC-type bacteriocin/lantibiotic exporter with double-glycine peptidase domain